MTFPPVLQVIPSRASSARDLPALETTMQALAIDGHAAIAVEIAATATTRQFLLRGESTVAVHYLEKQIQARYPQARIAPVRDPLLLAAGEECSMVELRAGAASFFAAAHVETARSARRGHRPAAGDTGRVRIVASRLALRRATGPGASLAHLVRA